MLTNAFINKAEQPTDVDLSSELGKAKPLWDQLLSDLGEEQNLTTREWNSYPKAGWALRVKRKKRNIVYLSPSHGCFTAAFILGNKAMTAARDGRFSESVMQLFDDATKYPEGTGVRIEVRKAKDLSIVKKLVAIKLEN